MIFLLRVILLIVVVYLILRFVGRILFGFSSPRSQSGNFGPQYRKESKEGEVFIKYNPENRDKIIRDDDGEYVKFEEVDDEDQK